MSTQCSSPILYPILVSTRGIHPATVLTLNSQPFFSHPASPEVYFRGSHLSKLASSIIIPMLSSPVEAFVFVPGISSGTSGRWARWHSGWKGTKKNYSSSVGMVFSDWTWCCPNYLNCCKYFIFRNKFGMSVYVSLCRLFLASTFFFLSLLLFQAHIKTHLYFSVCVFLGGVSIAKSTTEWV